MISEGRFKGSFRTVALIAVLSAGVIAASCSSGSSGTAAPTSAGQTTATWAEAPQTPPNFIFPFTSLAFFSVSNTTQFQYLMYRPLYWFGQGTTPNLNSTLSLAANPTYSADSKSVTINLDNYKWSNGETVTSQDIMFWMNMLHAQKSNWAGYAPGTLPDNLQSITVNSPTQLTMTMTAPVNSYWFTYNELSQITPMPNAWDVTATGGAANSGGCAAAPYGTADGACTAVYTFLEKQAGYDPANPKATNNSLATYATNPLWQVVNGPFHLTRFDASGNITMEANPSYSGPIKPTIKTFQELPYTSDSAEFNALVGGKVDVGYLPTADVTSATSNALVAGPNNPRLSSTYNLDPLYTWAINYFPYNFTSQGDAGNAGAIFSQLYFRQAVQLLVDQPLYISKIDKGYGVGTFGPVPSEPSNPFVSAEVKNNPYPYKPSKAISLLKNHGWNVVPNGTSTCANPGTGANQCGANVPAGAKLSFDLPYASGSGNLTQLMNAEKASWSSAGINMSLSQQSFNTVLGNSTPCTGSTCNWELGNWGAGWIFSPDYYPTGEPIFQTGAGSNSGSYSDPTNDAYILATNTTQAPLTQYENYLAEQLPVIYQPNTVTSLTEITKSLTGVTPQSPLWALNPETWRFHG
jgi:peptide/nickel transport system substrate-binding protein